MKPLKIGVYRRVSTDDQVNVFEGSLESQKYRIDEFVRFKNSQSSRPWGEIVDYYDEEGVSAKSTNRPEYQRLMNDIRKGRVNMILVSDLTRLSRNLLDFCNLIDELERHNASYLSMKEQFDTSTPIGRMIVYIIIALGQFERETTSERVAVNCHTRSVKGLRNGGTVPLGYNRDPLKPGILVINEEEAAQVKTIFNVFLEEGSRSKAINSLHDKKIFPRQTPKQIENNVFSLWDVQSLGNVLRNYAYVGINEVNKLNKEEDSQHLKPWQQYQVVKAAWPAIIDDTTFYEAQSLLFESYKFERARISKGTKQAFLLTGLLTCGETGLALVGQTGTGRNNVKYRYYHYPHPPQGVTRPRLNAGDLETKVFQELESSLTKENYFSNIEKRLENTYKGKYNDQIQNRKRIMQELEKNRQSTSAIWANQSRMSLSDDALKLASEELNRLASEKFHLEAEAKKLTSIPDDIEFKTQALFMENQIRSCVNGWKKASVSLKKRLLRRTIKEIIVTGNDLQITFWTSYDEQRSDFDIKNENISDISKFRRPKSQISDIKKPALGGSFSLTGTENLYVGGSGDVQNGGLRRN